MSTAVGYSHYALRANKYVPAMQYSADAENNAPIRIDFGTPAASETTSIANAVSIAAAVDTTLAVPVVAGATWGQIPRMVLSGAGTPTVVVFGYDFWGQPMSNTMTGNGTTAVNGTKAFKTVTRYTSTLVAATTLSIGFAGILGLPYKAIKVLTEELDDVIVGTLGTLATPVLTDPQTATTGDPRGLYTPQSTLTGTARLKAHFLFSNDKNASGNGGFMGIRHFTA